MKTRSAFCIDEEEHPMVTSRHVTLLFSALVLGFMEVAGQTLNKDSRAAELPKQQIPYTIEFNRVCFMASDTVYRFTRFTEENGYMYFQVGFADSTHTIDPDLVFTADGSVYRLEPAFNPQVDTIYSYRKSANVNYDTTFSDVVVKGVHYFNSALYDDMRFSEILQSADEHPLDEDIIALRTVDYFPGSFQKHPTFLVEKIVFGKDSAICTRIEGESIDFNGFRVTRRESFTIDANSLKRIRKRLSAIPTEPVACITGDPWLLEYRNQQEYSNYIIADVCHLYEDRKNKKSRNDIILLHAFIHSLLP
ncbi:MAG: hypothetical protein GC178_09975 [Flavobacteriales bacterium]|nr:hypothetical protein [Flavobacteriales bacterium]